MEGYIDSSNPLETLLSNVSLYRKQIIDKKQELTPNKLSNLLGMQTLPPSWRSLDYFQLLEVLEEKPINSSIIPWLQMSEQPHLAIKQVLDTLLNGMDTYLEEVVTKIEQGEVSIEDAMQFTKKGITSTSPDLLNNPIASYESNLQYSSVLLDCVDSVIEIVLYQYHIPMTSLLDVPTNTNLLNIKNRCIENVKQGNEESRHTTAVNTLNTAKQYNEQFDDLPGFVRRVNSNVLQPINYIQSKALKDIFNDTYSNIFAMIAAENLLVSMSTLQSR